MNATDYDSIPIDPSFKETQKVKIVAGSVLLYIGIFGNLTALGTLIRKWKADNRVYFFLACLCVADIIGIGVREGIDIGWNTTYIWTASETACKVCMFFYTFGNTLSHYFLVAFNVDSAVTVLTFRSSKILRILMICVSVVATVCINAPKPFIFSLQRHPLYPKLIQCVTFGYFEDPQSETIFTIVMTVAIFWFPLFLIMLTSIPTILTWFKTSGVEFQNEKAKDTDKNELRTMTLDLAMVITLNFVFVFCWTPIVVCTLLFRFSKETYLEELWMVSQLLSVSSSCINPIVYGIFGCMR